MWAKDENAAEASFGNIDSECLLRRELIHSTLILVLNTDYIRLFLSEFKQTKKYRKVLKKEHSFT